MYKDEHINQIVFLKVDEKFTESFKSTLHCLLVTRAGVLSRNTHEVVT